MTTYVLVHGAWHGGWSWREVAGGLTAAGHTVYAPTLTGLGERSHLRGEQIGLSTHVADVRGVLRYEDLHDVVLVGHSYAGFVVRQAADQMPERVGSLVMLDAWAGKDGQSLMDLAPDWFRGWTDSATENGAIAPPPPAAVGVTRPGDAARLEALLTPQPRRTFTEPTRLTGAVEVIPCRAIVCEPGGVPFREWAADFGWSQRELATGHDAMVTAPDELARLLLEAA